MRHLLCAALSLACLACFLVALLLCLFAFVLAIAGLIVGLFTGQFGLGLGLICIAVFEIGGAVAWLMAVDDLGALRWRFEK